MTEEQLTEIEHRCERNQGRNDGRIRQDVTDLLAEVKRLRCCGNCEHFETVCGEGKCFVECEKPAWRFDKKVRYTDGSGKCEKWEVADNG